MKDARGFKNWLRSLARPRSEFRMEEDDIPRDSTGKPDVSHYTKPLAYYIDLHREALKEIPSSEMSREQANFRFRQRVHATWALMTKGPEAAPYLLTILNSKNPDAREDASFLLGELKNADGIADSLLLQLNSETDSVARSTMISALGRLRYRPAIPALAQLILREDVDRDTKLDAVESLGSISKAKFSASGDSVMAATAWLADQGYAPKPSTGGKS